MGKIMSKDEFINICHTELKHTYKIQSGHYVSGKKLNTLVHLASLKLTNMEHNLKTNFIMIHEKAYDSEEERRMWIKSFNEDLAYYRKLKEELKGYIVDDNNIK